MPTRQDGLRWCARRGVTGACWPAPVGPVRMFAIGGIGGRVLHIAAVAAVFPAEAEGGGGGADA